MQELQFYERAQAQTHSMTLACMAQVQQYRARAAEWAPLAAEAKSTAGQERYRSLAQHLVGTGCGNGTAERECGPEEDQSSPHAATGLRV
jgi:hypothetical protein